MNTAEYSVGDIVTLIADAISYGKGKRLYAAAGSKAVVVSINHQPVLLLRSKKETFHIHINKIEKMIKAQVIGHLGKDAVFNNINGKGVINFSVAHTKKFKDAKGALCESTIWVSCSYWTDRSNLVPYLKKGTLIHVEGEPSVSTYQNNQQVTMAELRLRVSHVELLSSSNKGEQTARPAAGSSQTDQFKSDFEDLPF